MKKIITHKYLMFIVLIINTNSYVNAQKNHLENYIPHEKTSLSSHPKLIIKTWVHIIQKNYDDPQNITKDSIEFIEDQFKWINQMYKNLKKPSLKAMDGTSPYVPNSRIEFIIDTISFHVDETGWDRMKMVPVTNPHRLIEILKIDKKENSILVKGQ